MTLLEEYIDDKIRSYDGPPRGRKMYLAALYFLNGDLKQAEIAQKVGSTHVYIRLLYSKNDRFWTLHRRFVLEFCETLSQYLETKAGDLLAGKDLSFADITDRGRYCIPVRDCLYSWIMDIRGRDDFMESGDKKFAILLALKNFPDKSQQEIAERVGCSQKYVSEVKKDNIPTYNDNQGVNIPTYNYPSTRIDSRGRTRPTTYKINKEVDFISRLIAAQLFGFVRDGFLHRLFSESIEDDYMRCLELLSVKRRLKNHEKDFIRKTMILLKISRLQ